MRPIGAKDWNALLTQRGADALEAQLARAFGAMQIDPVRQDAIARLDAPQWTQRLHAMHAHCQSEALPSTTLLLPGGYLVRDVAWGFAFSVALLRQSVQRELAAEQGTPTDQIDPSAPPPLTPGDSEQWKGVVNSLLAWFDAHRADADPPMHCSQLSSTGHEQSENAGKIRP